MSVSMNDIGMGGDGIVKTASTGIVHKAKAQKNNVTVGLGGAQAQAQNNGLLNK